MHQPTKESFLNDVKNHEITILKDDGLYRHICMSKGSFDQKYYIITFPGGLLFTGDMGTYEFERTEDMFSFFRTGISDNGDIGINSAYWAEKCKSESVFGNGIREFSPEHFKENVKFFWEEYFTDKETTEAKEVWEEINSSILNCEDAEWDCVASLNNFSTYGIKTDFDFGDFWESSVDLKTYNFLWCLYAIVFAIKMYESVKVNN